MNAPCASLRLTIILPPVVCVSCSVIGNGSLFTCNSAELAYLAASLTCTLSVSQLLGTCTVAMPLSDAERFIGAGGIALKCEHENVSVNGSVIPAPAESTTLIVFVNDCVDSSCIASSAIWLGMSTISTVVLFSTKPCLVAVMPT